MNANEVRKDIVSGSLLAPVSRWYATVQKAEDVHRMEYLGLAICIPRYPPCLGARGTFSEFYLGGLPLFTFGG